MKIITRLLEFWIQFMLISLFENEPQVLAVNKVYQTHR